MLARACVHVCAPVCMYVCVHVCTWVHVCTCVPVRVCACVHVGACVPACVRVCACVPCVRARVCPAHGRFLPVRRCPGGGPGRSVDRAGRLGGNLWPQQRCPCWDTAQGPLETTRVPGSLSSSTAELRLLQLATPARPSTWTLAPPAVPAGVTGRSSCSPCLGEGHTVLHPGPGQASPPWLRP